MDFNKQKAISKSSTEAKYCSVVAALADIKWIINLLHELHLTLKLSCIYSDNMGVILLAVNPIMHSKTKHFELDLYFVRKSIQNKQLTLLYISATDQIVDTLTKPLCKS